MASSLYNEFLVQAVQSLRSVQSVHRWEESGIDLNERFERIEPVSNIDQQACRNKSLSLPTPGVAGRPGQFFRAWIVIENTKVSAAAVRR